MFKVSKLGDDNVDELEGQLAVEEFLIVSPTKRAGGYQPYVMLV